MEKKRVIFGVCLTILLVVIGLSLFEVFAATTTITDVSSAASTLLNVTSENNFTHLTIGDSTLNGGTHG